MNILQKALNILEIAFLDGKISRDVIEKARTKTGVYADNSENRKLHRVGKPYEKGKEEVEPNKDGSEEVASPVLGMIFEKYSNLAMIIRGETYANLNLIRKIKGELGVGIWNGKEKGWIFPLSMKDRVMAFFSSSVDSLDDKKEEMVTIKNTYNVGTKIKGKNQNGEILSWSVQDGSVYYEVKTDDGQIFKHINEKLIQVLPEKEDKKIVEELQKATPETRINVEIAINGTEKPEEIRTPEKVIEKEIEKVEKIQEDHKIEPVVAKMKFVDFKNGITHPVKDFTDIKAVEILLPKEKDVLKKDRPSYIPEIDEVEFKRKGHVFDVVKLEDNKYLVALGGYSKSTSTRKYNQTTGAWDDIPHNNDLAVMTLDQLAATQQYYRLKSKADLKEKEKDKTRKSRIHILSDRRTNYSTMYLYEDATGNKGGSKLFWAANGEQHSDIKQKVIDISLQQEEIENSYSKGLETSYGNKGTSDALLKDYGVKVKRQNGDVINQSEIADIKTAMDSVYSVFGSKNEINKEFNLKISHAGEKMMFARKAIGIFYPSFNAIGVTFGDPKQGGITLSHEYAHFMDYWIGKTTGNHYGSDSQGSLSNQIASGFRKHMNEKQTSDYQNRTCEVFARAFEQYFDKKTAGADYGTHRLGNHVSDAKFTEHIEPLIDRYFKENGHILKSLNVNIVK